MNKHPKYERTLVLIKPDGIQRTLVGEIISRFERVGLKLAGMKMVMPSAEMVEKHYTLDPEWFRKTGEKSIKAYADKGLKPPHEDPIEVAALILQRLKKYITAGPVIVMVWQGAHAVAIVRKLVGGTEPLSSADIGTIRGDYALDSYGLSDSDERAVRNLVHASGSVAEATSEIRHWFGENEIIDYHLIGEAALYEADFGANNN